MGSPATLLRYPTPTALLGAQDSSFGQSTLADIGGPLHFSPTLETQSSAECDGEEDKQTEPAQCHSINTHRKRSGSGSSQNGRIETEEDVGLIRSLTVRQGLTLFMLCSSNVSSAMYASLVAPFFPTEVSNDSV